jgi:hypothetical protein
MVTKTVSGVVTGAEVFAARYVRSALVRSGDEELAGIDVGELECRGACLS